MFAKSNLANIDRFRIFLTTAMTINPFYINSLFKLTDFLTITLLLNTGLADRNSILIVTTVKETLYPLYIEFDISLITLNMGNMDFNISYLCYTL